MDKILLVNCHTLPSLSLSHLQREKEKYPQRYLYSLATRQVGRYILSPSSKRHTLDSDSFIQDLLLYFIFFLSFTLYIYHFLFLSLNLFLQFQPLALTLGSLNTILSHILAFLLVLKKCDIPGLFFFIFAFSIQLTVNVQYKFLPMAGFEPRTSGIGSDVA